jgi:hypothetical protein
MDAVGYSRVDAELLRDELRAGLREWTFPKWAAVNRQLLAAHPEWLVPRGPWVPVDLRIVRMEMV